MGSWFVVTAGLQCVRDGMYVTDKRTEARDGVCRQARVSLASAMATLGVTVGATSSPASAVSELAYLNFDRRYAPHSVIRTTALQSAKQTHVGF